MSKVIAWLYVLAGNPGREDAALDPRALARLLRLPRVKAYYSTYSQIYLYDSAVDETGIS